VDVCHPWVRTAMAEVSGVTIGSLGSGGLTASWQEVPSKRFPQRPTPWMNEFNDNVILSTEGTLQSAGNGYVSTGRPGEYIDSAGGKFVSISDALTSDDKALVRAATGGLNLIDANGVHQVNQLAVTIALDRSMGNLTGAITASYLNKLKNDQQQTLGLNQQASADLIAAGRPVDARALASQAPGVSFGVIDKALAFLANKRP